MPFTLKPRLRDPSFVISSSKVMNRVISLHEAPRIVRATRGAHQYNGRERRGAVRATSQLSTERPGKKPAGASGASGSATPNHTPPARLPPGKAEPPGQVGMERTSSKEESSAAPGAGRAVQWPGQSGKSLLERRVPEAMARAAEAASELVNEENMEMYLGVLENLRFAAANTAHRTSEAVQQGTEAAMHSTIEGALSLMFRTEARVDAFKIYARGGVLLTGVAIGHITMDKMLLRVNSLPMLAAALQSWKGKERQGLPLHLDALTIHGMRVANLRGSSIKNLHTVFTKFPSTLSIHKLALVNTDLALAPTGWGDSTSGRTVSHPGVALYRIEFTDIWNTMSGPKMLACFTDIVEPDVPEWSTSILARGDSRPRHDEGLTSPDELARWRNDWRRERIKEAYENVSNIVKIIPMPVPEDKRPKLMKFDEVERIGGAFADEAPVLARAAMASLTLQGPNLQTAMDLVQQGVPLRMLENSGDLLVKMIDTGVADAVLERPTLTKDMVAQGILEPMIRAGVLHAALENPEVVIELVQQGILDDLVASGSFSTLLEARNTDILKKLLKGPLLAELTYTRVLADLFNHQR